MLGPSFSPSIARIPGPTSNHIRYQRRPWRRALCTRKRSRERISVLGVSGGQRDGAVHDLEPARRAASGGVGGVARDLNRIARASAPPRTWT
jgi:hypothetical protein